MPLQLQDSTLLLLGHGSTLNAQSSAPVRLHADALRARGVFGQVLASFWKQEPSFASALRSAWHRDVIAVPVFISEGYFTQQVIPRELGIPTPPSANPTLDTHFVGRHRLRYCAPVGIHPSMTDVIASRAMAVVSSHPAPGGPPTRGNISLFVAGHGTSNSETSRRAIEDHVASLRSTGTFHDVHAVFMEESPRIQDIPGMASSPNIVVVPFFLSDGLHSQEDIPVMLGADPATVARRLESGLHTWENPTLVHGRWTWYSPAVGGDPAIADVILRRAMERADSPCGLAR